MALIQHLRYNATSQLVQEVQNAAICLAASRRDICRRAGLTVPRWRALSLIARSSFALSISDLARALRSSRQTAWRLTVGIAKAGWIQFLPNQDDRRLLQMELTDRGRAILHDVDTQFSAWLLVMAHDLEARELQELAHTARRIRERIARARGYE